MNQDEVLDIFRASGALLEGHFILSSGLRSPIFLQKARVFMYPDRTERLCKALAAKVRAAELDFDLVVSPALGGLIPGYETARQKIMIFIRVIKSYFYMGQDRQKLIAQAAHLLG